MADFFEKIGPLVNVTAEDFKNLSGPQALQLYVSSLEKAGANQAQMTFFMEALSSEATSLLPLLRNGGAEMLRFGNSAQEAGQIIDDSVIASASRAHTALQTITLTLDSLKLRLAAEVAPALEEVAERFNVLARTTLAAAVERLSKAFGNLVDVILEPEFIDAVAGAFEGLANFTAGAAEAFVIASQNVEVLTVAFGGLAVAVAAVGGPLTLVAGALAAALVGISTWRGRLNDVSTSAEAAKQAQENLNTALGTFSQTGAPSAASEALGYAQDLKTQAEAALAAAEAELALHRAEAVRIGDMVKNGHLRNLTMEEQAKASAKEHRLLTQLTQATGDLANARLTVANLQLGAADRPTLPGTDGGGDSGDPPEDLPILPGGGGADEIAARLEALQQGLMTERELLETWREENLEALKSATDQELEAIGGVNAAKLRLEEEYQRRLAEIRSTEQSQTLNSYGTLFGNLATTFKAGSGKLLKISKAFSVAQGLINSYRAFTEVLADPSLIGRPFLRTALAASTLASGLAQVANIKSVSDNGGGGVGATTPAAGAAAPQQPGQNIVIDFQGDTFSRESGIALIERINDAVRDGGRIEGILAQ